MAIKRNVSETEKNRLQGHGVDFKKRLSPKKKKEPSDQHIQDALTLFADKNEQSMQTLLKGINRAQKVEPPVVEVLSPPTPKAKKWKISNVTFDDNGLSGFDIEVTEWTEPK